MQDGTLGAEQTGRIFPAVLRCASDAGGCTKPDGATGLHPARGGAALAVQKLAPRRPGSHTSRMLRLPGTAVQVLEIARETSRHRAALCLSRAPWGGLQAHAAEFLHADEQRQLQVAGVPKRQADYLRGRYCAKLALVAREAGLVARDTCVASGVFGQPVVCGDAARGRPHAQVSIAHSADWAAAVACDEVHPMAIDLEALDPRHAETLRGEVTAEERAAFAPANLGEPRSLTLIWAAREALAKVLRTGLMTPLHLYEVGRVEAAAEAVTCEYRHFGQYKCCAGFVHDLAIAIALPRKSALQLDWRALSVETG